MTFAPTDFRVIDRARPALYPQIMLDMDMPRSA